MNKSLLGTISLFGIVVIGLFLLTRGCNVNEPKSVESVAPDTSSVSAPADTCGDVSL